MIHHSHITCEITGYSHSFCNAKVRESYHKITVVAHNLFRYNFFFILKGLRAGVWRTRNIKIGGKNPTDINFANIANQIQFLDTIKYFQQSLGVLAESLTDQEKSAVSRECEKIIKNDPKLAKKYLSCTMEKQKWVLNYLSMGQGTIPYQMIAEYDSLDIVAADGLVFLSHQFFTMLKNFTKS